VYPEDGGETIEFEEGSDVFPSEELIAKLLFLFR
jgi:hypothetical protein